LSKIFSRTLKESADKKVKPTGARTAVGARWCQPPEGECKINVDGAVAKTKTQGAVGAVCRSYDGFFLGASAVVFNGVTDPGCLEGLSFPVNILDHNK
jgi:hypothetical protein